MTDDKIPMWALMQEAYEQRDRLAEARQQADVHSRFQGKEIACLSGRAFLYILGKEDEAPFGILPVACGRNDTQRFVSSSDIESLFVRHKPLMFEVSCPNCWMLWRLASLSMCGDEKASEDLRKFYFELRGEELP